MSPSPEAKQAAENLYLRRSYVGIDKDRYSWEEAEKIVQQAIDAATAKLRTDAEAWRLVAKGKEGAFVKLLAFAELVEPYVANDYCHDKSALGHKLYSACCDIRQYIYGKDALAHQQPSAPTAEAGNHDCEYPSESEDARCIHCGLTSSEAVKYFEGLDQKQIAPAPEESDIVGPLLNDWCARITPTPDVEKLSRETARKIKQLVIDSEPHRRLGLLNLMQTIDRTIEGVVSDVLAQALAPLAVALEQIRDMSWHQVGKAAIYIASAALTGLGDEIWDKIHKVK